MKLPYVNAIGITIYPREFSARPRPPRRGLRVLAVVLIVLFSVSVVTTTILSVGGYCLTSDGGDTRDLPPMTGAL